MQQNWNTFNKYYSELNNLFFYVAVIILYLSCCTQYIWYNWKKEWQWSAFQNVKRLWKIYCESLIINFVRIFSYEADLFWNLDDYDLFAWDLNKFKKSVSQNEYENYIKEKSIEINDSSLF